MKKFVAKTSREALRLVSAELGADAVILSNRKVDEGVEIIALAGAEFMGLTQEPKQPAPVQLAPAATKNTIPATVAATPVMEAQQQQGILSEIKFMRDMMQEQIACLSWSDMQQRDPQRTRMLRELLNSGFSPAL